MAAYRSATAPPQTRSNEPARKAIRYKNIRQVICTNKEGIQTYDQSYTGCTIVNYGSRVMICGIFKSGTTLES